MTGDASPAGETKSAPGEFYVDSSCCTSCGVPQVVAPDLVGWVDERLSHCYWKKQPETADEMQRAIAIFDSQELGCHRYAGRDLEIQARLGYENCDHPPEGVFLRSGSRPEPGIPDDRGILARLLARRFRRRRARLKRGW